MMRPLRLAGARDRPGTTSCDLWVDGRGVRHGSSGLHREKSCARRSSRSTRTCANPARGIGDYRHGLTPPHGRAVTVTCSRWRTRRGPNDHPDVTRLTPSPRRQASGLRRPRASHVGCDDGTRQPRAGHRGEMSPPGAWRSRTTGRSPGPRCSRRSASRHDGLGRRVPFARRSVRRTSGQFHAGGGAEVRGRGHPDRVRKWKLCGANSKSPDAWGAAACLSSPRGSLSRRSRTRPVHGVNVRGRRRITSS